MKKLTKESKTTECLIKSFAGESMARNRYDYYAKIADKEGYKQISAIFSETALNEKAHAKRFYNFLGNDFEYATILEASFPIGLSNTLKNLEISSKGEHEENSLLYPSFEKIAREEGYIEIADNYLEIIEAEKAHEARYLALIENLKSDKVFKKDEEVIWHCRNCGYLHRGKEAPMICPSCKHKQEYFELYCNNY